MGGAGGSLASGSANPRLSASSNLMGINIAAPLDYQEDRLYADVIKMSRPFVNGSNPDSTTPAPVNANGWPGSDFSFYVWAGIGQMQGTYTLSFQGQATVSGSAVGNINLSYDPATNTSTGTFQ